MFTIYDSPYLVPLDGTFSIAESPTEPPSDSPGKKECEEQLEELVEELGDLQRVLYADDRYSLLLVFQALDAAGKDGTIRAVLTGVNPAGCEVHSFKKPSAEELDHDFLWRTTKRLPQRGRIGVFNRSYYEEVLVVRVHPELLEYQKLPQPIDHANIWDSRMNSITEHEKHLHDNGTIVLKFWLNVSPEEQRERFLKRIDECEKNWKFSEGDVTERQFWDKYMHAYEEALQRTSKAHAPWYAIPADNKRFMRLTVAKTIIETLRSLDISYPKVSAERKQQLQAMRDLL